MSTTNPRVDTRAAGIPLRHFWSQCVGAGRANEGLRANWRKHLEQAVGECGFRYLRFHGLFHEDMFVYRKTPGGPVYNWQYIDELFDGLLEAGIRPFVELGFCPADMASGTQTMFWWKSNVTPPADLSAWSELVRRAVTHWIARYGSAEVRSWYFEVWNEPNLYAFWAGTRSQYLELYKATALAVKGVDGVLRVGGPATSNFVPDDRFTGELELVDKQTTFTGKDLDAADWRAVWLQDLVEYARRNDLPVDFLSTHPYPTDFALDVQGKFRGFSRTVDSTRNDLRWLRAFVARSPFPNAEIHCTEWSSSPSPRDHSHDDLPAATFIVKTNIDSTGLVDSLSYWTFTDVFEEGGAGDTVFHGGFGMINAQGIPKPAFHAYRFLHGLGDREIGRGPDWIATKDARGVSLLAWNYPVDAVSSAVPMSTEGGRAVIERVTGSGSPSVVCVTLEGLTGGGRFEVETLDASHGNAIAAWKAMGAPEPPTREQTAALITAARATHRRTVTADAGGVLALRLDLGPWAVAALRPMPR